MTRLAAIDCGTNSIRLLVADHDIAAGTLTDRLRRTELVRLGQDVDRTGRLARKRSSAPGSRSRRTRPTASRTRSRRCG